MRLWSSGARSHVLVLTAGVLWTSACIAQEADQAHPEFQQDYHHHHARLPQASEEDCDFGNTRAIFTDLFGSSYRSPWLLCAVESAMGKIDSTSVVVVTDNREEFSIGWPSQLPNPGRQVSISKCLDGTPLKAWLDSQELASSHFRQQNIANAARLAALYKSGGTYLDLDIIPLHKEIFDADVGSISRQCEIKSCGEGFFLNNAFLSFPAKAPFVFKLMEAFVSEFNGNVWGWNGPRLVSSLYKRMLCDSEAGVHDCHKLKLLPIERLAPFDWDEIMPVLSSQPDESYTQLLNNSQILAIHAYHNVWQQECIPYDSVFHRMMSDHCPMVAAEHDSRIFCQHSEH